MIAPAVKADQVTLRPWREDEADIYARMRDDLVFRFTTETPAADTSACRAVIQRDRDHPDRASFAICGPDGRPAGNLSVVRVGQRVILSYWLAPQARGRRWASAALRATTDWAFGNWDVTEAELEIDLDNVASKRVAAAAGYTRYGTRLTSACGGPAAIYRRAPAGRR